MMKRYKGKKVKGYKGERAKWRTNMIGSFVLGCMLACFGCAFLLGAALQWNEPDRHPVEFTIIGAATLVGATLAFCEFWSCKKELGNWIRDKYYNTYNESNNGN